MYSQQTYGSTMSNPNVDFAFRITDEVLMSLMHQGIIDQQTASVFKSQLNNPNVNASYQSQLAGLLGMAPQSDVVVRNAVATIIQQSVASMFQQQQQQQMQYNNFMPQQQNSYIPMMSNGCGYPPPQLQNVANVAPQQYFSNPGAANAINGLTTTIYGSNNQQQTGAELLNTHNLVPNRVGEVNTPPPAVSQVMPAYQPATGQVHPGVDLSEDVFLNEPDWTPVDLRLSFAERFGLVSKAHTVKCADVKVESAEIQVEYSSDDLSSTINTVFEAGLKDDLVSDITRSTKTKPFAHVLTINENVPVRLNFPYAKHSFDACVEAYKDADLKAVRSVIRVINSGDSAFRSFITPIILSQFNHAASVNFIMFTPTGSQRIPELTDLSEIEALIADTDDHMFDSWKDRTEEFKVSLGNTLKMSFSRLFKKHRKAYLDPTSSKEDRDTILMCANTGIVHQGLVGKQIVVDPNISDDEKMALANEVFVLLLERKILLHNLDLPSIDDRDYKPKIWDKTPEMKIVRSIAAKLGNLEMVSQEDIQAVNPPIAGQAFGGRLIVRRN